MRYASVVRTIAKVTGQPVLGIHIVGGGSRNDYLNQATASASGMPVAAGPAEATAIGNVLVQAIADGRFSRFSVPGLTCPNTCASDVSAEADVFFESLHVGMRVEAQFAQA